MKTVYIPAGKNVEYEFLSTENLIVDGRLRVVNGVKAKKISGKGVISAGTVYADDICIDEIEAAAVVCVRCVAKRVDAPEVYATESIAVSCFLSASYVETGRLTVALSDISEVKADEVINLPRHNYSLLGLLIASFLRSLWARLFAVPEGSAVMDADFAPADGAAEQRESSADQTAEAAPEAAEKTDEELSRVIALFKLSREAGYTLRIIPGKPEENAPVFDFATETIVEPAA